MTISDEAVEAAAKALLQVTYPHDAEWDVWDEPGHILLRMEARTILEAAAPFIQAQALEDAADKVMGPSDVLLDAATCRWIAMEMRERAASERGGEP